MWAVELAAAPFDARAQQYRLAGVQGFRCVRVLGVCVRVSRVAAAQTQLEIGARPHSHGRRAWRRDRRLTGPTRAYYRPADDGTGVVRVRVGSDVQEEQHAALTPGALVRRSAAIAALARVPDVP